MTGCKRYEISRDIASEEMPLAEVASPSEAHEVPATFVGSESHQWPGASKQSTGSAMYQ